MNGANDSFKESSGLRTPPRRSLSTQRCSRPCSKPNRSRPTPGPKPTPRGSVVKVGEGRIRLCAPGGLTHKVEAKNAGKPESVAAVSDGTLTHVGDRPPRPATEGAAKDYKGIPGLMGLSPYSNNVIRRLPGSAGGPRFRASGAPPVARSPERDRRRGEVAPRAPPSGDGDGNPRPPEDRGREAAQGVGGMARQ